MKDWKITLTGNGSVEGSTPNVDKLARDFIRQARVAGVKVEAAMYSVDGNQTALGLDDPTLSRENALSTANHPDPSAAAQLEARRNETADQREVREARERLERAGHSTTAGKTPDVTRVNSPQAGDVSKAPVDQR
jgi:hypothetical protein